MTNGLIVTAIAVLSAGTTIYSCKNIKEQRIRTNILLNNGREIRTALLMDFEEAKYCQPLKEQGKYDRYPKYYISYESQPGTRTLVDINESDYNAFDGSKTYYVDRTKRIICTDPKAHVFDKIKRLDYSPFHERR